MLIEAEVRPEVEEEGERISDQSWCGGGGDRGLFLSLDFHLLHYITLLLLHMHVQAFHSYREIPQIIRHILP